MKSTLATRMLITRISAALLIGVFLLNVYVGLYDKNLAQFQPTHLYANWVIALVTLIAAGILFARLYDTKSIIAAGIVWPIVYIAALAFDVQTRLCFGGNPANCWPTTGDAFNYLILNSPNVPNGFGWALPIPAISIALVLVIIACGLSLTALYNERRLRQLNRMQTATTGTTPGTGNVKSKTQP